MNPTIILIFSLTPLKINCILDNNLPSPSLYDMRHHNVIWLNNITVTEWVLLTPTLAPYIRFLYHSHSPPFPPLQPHTPPHCAIITLCSSFRLLQSLCTLLESSYLYIPWVCSSLTSCLWSNVRTISLFTASFFCEYVI